jgi:hypothetical protein
MRERKLTLLTALVGLFALALVAPLGAQTFERTVDTTADLASPSAELEPSDEACEEEPVALAAALARETEIAEIAFWISSPTGEQVPLLEGAGSPLVSLVQAEDGTVFIHRAEPGSEPLSADLDHLAAASTEFASQQAASLANCPCPLGLRHCGSGKCAAGIGQTCCTGGSGYAVCGILSGYPRCGVVNGRSTCCNLCGTSCL